MSKGPEYKTVSLITADRRGRKQLEKLLREGWVIVTQTKTALSRATQYTLRRGE